MYRWPQVKTVAFDIEGTGINTERDRILQYGLYGVDADGQVIDVSAVVDAETPTGRDPAKIPGVTPAELKNAQPIAHHLDTIEKVCTDAVVLIHQRHYDWNVLSSEFKRHDRRPPHPKQIVCTLQLAKHQLKLDPPHTLGALAERLHVRLDQAHNARDDARATFELYVRWANLYWPKWPHDSGWFANKSIYFPPTAFGRWARNIRAAAPLVDLSQYKFRE